MSFHRRENPSLLSSGGDLVDHLIYQALFEEVEGTEPSPQVWDNICRRIATPEVSQGRDMGVWVPVVLNRMQAALNVLFGDYDWEVRLNEHRRPGLWWLMPFSSGPVWSV